MRFLIALIVIGAVLIYFGVQELRLSSEAKPEPTTITCADLIKNGHGDNAHVKLTDFIVWAQEFVYESNSKYDKSSYTKIYVPVVAIDGEEALALQKALDASGKLVGDIPKPKNLGLILKSSKVKNDAELEKLVDAETIQGMIINKIDSLGSEETKLLKQAYPSVDFSKCLILEHDRQPAGSGKIFGFIGGGLALIAIPIVFLIVGRKSSAA